MKVYQQWEKKELQHRERLRDIAEDVVRGGVARKL